jgi:hypothetical protein
MKEADMCGTASSFSDQDIMVQAPAGPGKVTVRTPARLAKRPALLLNFAGDRRSAFEGDYFRIASDIFLAAGHRVASFDMPSHGEWLEPFGEGLAGMSKAMEAGVDIFGQFAETGKQFLDYAIAQGLVTKNAIVLDGTSRGGLAGLHLMARDERVVAIAIHAPLTWIPEPTEFRHLAGNALAERSSAAALVERLADRPIFMDIGLGDPRVGAHHCFDFHARLCAASRRVPPTLFTAPGISHGPTYPPESGHIAGAAFLLYQCAIRLKDPLGPGETI